MEKEVPYTYFALLYAGKPNELDGEGTKHYVKGKNVYTKYLVAQFIMHNDIDACNISMGQYFALVTLAEMAITQNFSIIRSIKLDRQRIPKDLRLVEEREANPLTSSTTLMM